MSINTLASIARIAGRSKGRSGSTRPGAFDVPLAARAGLAADFASTDFEAAAFETSGTGAAADEPCAGSPLAAAALTTAVVPTTGPRSTSIRRLPPSRPLSSGTPRALPSAGGCVYVNAPFKWLAPIVASSTVTFQALPSRTIRPLDRNGPVVGSVTPTGSPTAASDGPLRR